ncbi:branched-chain amino acid ABC transporter permease [Pusillimonas caeni]|uniref:branched-chain amino acid ABC transporter permease n=1 Tax=Pusillimonas caeni TaxID=1348472 RepID=UPI000E59C3DE|nr:branched-chain amino acid ABC transporter permease [Pusillimonas caeni]TFL11143.1 branched-chain amino acid ABC transporter permease [Pusillimonas caeni]
MISEQTRQALPLNGIGAHPQQAQDTIARAADALHTSRIRELLPIAAIFLALVLVPVVSLFLGHTYYLDLVSRAMILGLAAMGLNLILGYGGMVSFGHALYLGIGAYAVGMLSTHGVESALAQLVVAIAVGTIVSYLIGYICLKVDGMGFIMITLAFAQMFYYLAISLKQYGGDDGLPIAARSTLPGMDLENPYQFYLLVLAILAAAAYLLYRLVHSRFGTVIRGCKQNTRRMYALGFPASRYKLFAYVVSAQISVLAGVLLANLALFAAPSYMSWTLSGDLILMCVLGGLGTLLGPLIGAVAFVGLEEFLSTMPIDLGSATELITTHWLGFFGVFIVLVVLFLRRGLYGSFTAKGARHD